MRLTYFATHSESIHDSRFLHGWRALGVETKFCQIHSRDPNGVIKEVLDELTLYDPEAVQVGPIGPYIELVRSVWRKGLILTSWGSDLLPRAVDERMRDVVDSISFASSDVVLVDTNAGANVSLSLGAKRERVLVFPWGVEDSFFRAEYGRWGKDNRAVSPPNFVVNRKHEDLYDVGTAISGFLKGASTNSRLVVAGTGSLTESLVEETKGLDLNNQVKFVGHLDTKSTKQLLWASDIYINPALADGSSVSMLEAMASNLLTVASSTVGNREWISEETGFTYEPGSSEQLAGIISKICVTSNLDDLSQMVRKASALVSKKARWEENQLRLGDALEMVLG